MYRGMTVLALMILISACATHRGVCGGRQLPINTAASRTAATTLARIDREQR